MPTEIVSPTVDKARALSTQEFREANYLIIELEHAPIATYRGGVQGYPATAPRAGMRPIDIMSSAATASYQEFLQQEQANFVSQLFSCNPWRELRTKFPRYYQLRCGGSTKIQPRRGAGANREHAWRETRLSKRAFLPRKWMRQTA